MRARYNNQYFTPRDVVATCMTLMPPECLTANSFYIEPAAGDGAFYDALPRTRRIGVEIDGKVGGRRPYVLTPPRGEGFLDVTLEDLAGYNEQAGDRARNVVVGNPPFSQPRARGQKVAQGRACNMALRFVNHAASLAAHCCMLVGANFLRSNVLRKVSTRYRVLAQHDLGFVTFRCGKVLRRVRCCFVVWGPPAPSVGEFAAAVTVPKQYTYKKGRCSAHDDFEIVRPTDARANILIKRWGSVGKLTVQPTAIAARVTGEQKKQNERRLDPRYGPAWNTGRTCATDFYLYAKNKRNVVAVLQNCKPLLIAAVQNKTCGNNPSITVYNLMDSYLACKPTPSVSS